MKTSLKFFYAAMSLLSIALISSCSKDDDKDKGTSGVNTEMRIAISSPSNFKSVDENATVPEATLNTVDVFIYNENSELIKHQQLTSADFEYTPGVTDLYTGTTKISTTTGLRNVYVGVNLPSTLVDLIVTSGPSAVYSIMDIDDIASVVSYFSMFSEAKVTTVLVEDSNNPANSIYAPVKRLVAKVSLQESASLDKNIPGGVISDLQYTMKNINAKLYPLQLMDGPVIKDPNWNVQGPGVIASTDFYQTIDYIIVNPSTVSNVVDLNAKYTTENTSEDKYADEMTYVSVQATFVPNTIKVYMNGTDASAGYSDQNNVGSPATTFYRLAAGDGAFVYAIDPAVLTDWAIANSLNPGDVRTYNNGYCYYNVFLNPKNGYNVFRNDFYKTTITKINGLGNNSPEDVPHVPLAESSEMDVTIDILPWNVVDSETELTKKK